MRTVVVAAAILFGLGAALAQEWTRFRGPNGSGLSSATTIPTRWTDKDINWKIRLTGVGHSSPVLWGKRFFAEMQEIAGDVGARHLIGAYPELVVEIEMAGDGVLLDIDSPGGGAVASAGQHRGR